VKDGRIVYTARPPERARPSRRMAFDWSDMDAGAGGHYYYVRVIEKDALNPNGDPQMAWGSPFFVTQH
jgi:hypothetical protein